MSISIAKPKRGVPRLLRRVGIGLVCVIAVLALTAWAASILLRPHPPSPASITRAMRAQAALTGGARVYATSCAYCHDSGFGPALAQLGLSAQNVRYFVRSGPAMMPAFTPAQLSDADVDAVTAYLSSHPAPETSVR